MPVSDSARVQTNGYSFQKIRNNQIVRSIGRSCLCPKRLVALVACLAFPLAVIADPCEVVDDGSGTVVLPPDGCEYLSPDDVHEILDGLPPGTTIELGVSHRAFFCQTCTGGPTPGAPCNDDADCGGGLCRPAFNPECSFDVQAGCEQPGGGLGGEQECAHSELHLELTGTGDLAGYSRTIVLPVVFETHTGPRTPFAPIQEFPTDMFRLSGELTGDPDFDLLRITSGSSYGLPSPGHTTLTQLPSGDWNVDSFFDIAYRIEYQGAPGGALDGMVGDDMGMIRVGAGEPAAACCLPDDTCEDLTEALCQAADGRFHSVDCAKLDMKGGCDPPIPATSEWGLAVLALVVLIAGTVVLRRRTAIA
jgi:hypothetical protein